MAKLTKREMIEAMMAGKRLVRDGDRFAYFDEHGLDGPFVFLHNAHESRLAEGWNCEDWQIEEPPKRRLMSREEVLGFIEHTQGIVARVDEEEWQPKHAFEYMLSPDCYEWATIDIHGNIGEPHKFEIKED